MSRPPNWGRRRIGRLRCPAPMPWCISPAGPMVTSEQADAKTDQAYLRINAEGTRALAAQCAAAGVKHFIFLSSCHAIAGESDDVLTDRTVPQPVTVYGRS